MAKLMGFYPLIIELDLKNVIRLITSKFASRSEIGWLVDEFQDQAKDVANLVFT